MDTASDSLQVQRIAWGSLTMLRNSLPMLQSRADSLDNFDLSKKQQVSRCVKLYWISNMKDCEDFSICRWSDFKTSRKLTLCICFLQSPMTLWCLWSHELIMYVNVSSSLSDPMHIMNAADLSPYINAAPNWPGARSNGKKRTMRKSPPRRQQISVVQDGQSRSKT